MNAPVRQVVVVEDDPFLGGMIAETLSIRGFGVHHAAGAAEALALIEEHDPDALVVDLDLGQGPSGLDVINALGDRLPEFGVLVLSNYPNPAAMIPGVTLPPTVGYLVKRRLSSADDLVAALESLLADVVPRHARFHEAVPVELAMLTPGQFELLRLIAEGYSNETIATRRQVSVRSVESMVNRVFTALGLAADAKRNPRVTAAMLYARAMGVPRSDR